MIFYLAVHIYDVIWENPVTWCKVDILSYWYRVKVWIILFPELFTWIFSDAGIKSNWCSKAIKNQEKRLELWCLFPLFCSFALCDMWQVFPDHITFFLKLSIRVTKPIPITILHFTSNILLYFILNYYVMCAQ